MKGAPMRINGQVNAIGLLGIVAWLLGVLFVGAGLAGVFDTAQAPKPVAYVAEASHGQCTFIYPRGVKPTRITKANPVCTNGDLGATWRHCTLRYQA